MKKLYFIICLLSFFSCKKYKDLKDNNSVGNSYIRGRLFLTDTLTKNTVNQSLSSKIVQIFFADTQDTINDILPVTTDKDGYFTFRNLDESRTYRIYYEETEDSSRMYTAVRTDIKAPFDTLALNAHLDTTKEPGVIYSIVDEFGAPIKGASVCIFANISFFQEGKCDNSNYSLTTDAYGHAFVFNIPSGKYYVTSYISVNGSTYLTNDSLTVDSAIIHQTLRLAKAKQTGYNILVLDSLGTAVPNVQLCFFTSEVFFNTGNCSASNFHNNSDSNGISKGTAVTPGKYFVLANTTIDSLQLVAEEIVNIEKDKILADTMILHKK